MSWVKEAIESLNSDGGLLIGNNVGKVNGWIDGDAVIAKVILVEDGTQ